MRLIPEPVIAECSCEHFIPAQDVGTAAYAGAAHEAANPGHQVEIIVLADQEDRSLPPATYGIEHIMRWLKDPQRKIEAQLQDQERAREQYAARYGRGRRAAR